MSTIADVMLKGMVARRRPEEAVPTRVRGIPLIRAR